MIFRLRVGLTATEEEIVRSEADAAATLAMLAGKKMKFTEMD